MPAEREPSHTNRLAGETSPYLLQHAHNPVDWYPWGAEALGRAREMARPIFLSIGYAACHWCHVMERESFEDAATAADLNADFVAIKVDREERPDLDAIYMDAVQAMTGGGGWPMSVFLTPDGRPFYGGTYFPDEPRHGMPAFRQVLASIAAAWRDERPQVEAAAARLTTALQEQAARTAEAARSAAAEAARAAVAEAAAATPATGMGSTTEPSALLGQRAGASGLGGLVGPDGRPLLRVSSAPVVGPVVDRTILDRATANLAQTFDPAHGGWGGAPKFPAPMTIEHLLRRFLRAGDVQALTMARRTLDAMAAGGIHDQLGGGFARYATDAVWLVPHFEKMLYDNALLARAYLHAWQVTAEPRYREVVEDTLDYLLREMTVPGGAFAASQDADTDGEEGATYVWTADEIRTVLGPDQAALFADAYDVTESGNWEGKTILRRVRDDVALAARHAISGAQVAERLADARGRLLQARRGRPQPGRDDKALAAWNGLAIAAFAEASVALERPDYAAAATAAAAALWDGLRTPEGRLLRSWKDGRAKHAAVLEDHADLAEGLLALYQATFETRWYVAAVELAELIVDRFTDPAGGWFDTADDHEALVARPKSLQDNALPSGGAMATVVLLRLAAVTGEARYRIAAEAAVTAFAPLAASYPGGFAWWLVAADLAAYPIDEVAIVGGPDVDARPLLDIVRSRFRPGVVLAASLDDPATGSIVPLLRDRPLVDDQATAYVCRGFTCQAPTTSPDGLAGQLDA
jgi:uncharacterized protein YyaL (SSP411 family)